MGNACGCMPEADPGGGTRSRSKRDPASRSHRAMAASEEELLHRRALAIAIQQTQLSQRFEGSMSRRIGSTSSRRRDLPDSLANPKQQQVFLENLQTKKIVLVHGEGFGAWCWYKTVSLLEESGLHPVAVDLRGSGINTTDPNKISTLADYSKPLTDYLTSLPGDEKVILVGHSCGGASVSYASERFPKKVSKAIFVTATMVSDGQKPFDILSEELASADVFLKESQFLIYGNGRDEPPTGLMFDKQQLKGLYFNQSPNKDVSLASLSMRPVPLPPIMEKLSLTPENYGSVQRYFIQTLDDRMLSPNIQEKLVRENPARGVYKIKGSDHCPFFSKPQSLHKILLEIMQLP
ncbi:putative methylesterase 14, chloroplastic isoform X2 [Zingiber officinale]|uniref:putative methylesterase 14, chloroplastic isoform X2 n=1 Tax=Zingiber officinale TaxID=94328 RepID=UPI001C4D1ED2|nr:putative methylesterase 14, chloroplastic isoform X2 [Zingiber officinale]